MCADNKASKQAKLVIVNSTTRTQIMFWSGYKTYLKGSKEGALTANNGNSLKVTTLIQQRNLGVLINKEKLPHPMDSMYHSTWPAIPLCQPAITPASFSLRTMELLYYKNRVVPRAYRADKGRGSGEISPNPWAYWASVRSYNCKLVQNTTGTSY